MLNIWCVETERLMLKNDLHTWMEVDDWLNYFRLRYGAGWSFIIVRLSEETNEYYFVH